MKDWNIEGADSRFSAGGGFEGRRNRSILVAVGALVIMLLLCTTVSADDVAVPDQTDCTAEDVAGEGRGDDQFSMFTIRLRPSPRTSTWRCATMISWAPKGEQPPHVSATSDADRWVFRIGKRRVPFEW